MSVEDLRDTELEDIKRMSDISKLEERLELLERRYMAQPTDEEEWDYFGTIKLELEKRIAILKFLKTIRG